MQGSAVDRRMDVACLALDGCVLGWLAGVYPEQATWWRRALRAVADYAGVPLPAGSSSPRWDEFPLRDDEPLIDAVLTLARAGGVGSVTLDRVARVADRDPEWLDSMYGSAQELVDEVLDRVMTDGFDDLAPLHLAPGRAAVESTLAVLVDDRRAAALLRTLLLSGVEVSQRAASAARHLSPAALIGHERLSDEVLVAALALDGWALDGGRGELDDRVAVELRRMTH